MPQRPIKIIFFGDSICVGQNLSIHKGWVTRISARLAEMHDPHAQVIVMNASANGRTTRLALEAMPYEVQSQNAQLIILQFGINDCNYWQTDYGVPRVSPKAFEANLDEIITRAFNRDVKKVLINTNHPTGLTDTIMCGTSISYQDSNALYNEIIRRVAQKGDERVVLNDIERFFLEHSSGDRKKLEELLLPAPDLLHLSDKGHELYYRYIGPVVEAAVNELLEGVPA